MRYAPVLAVCAAGLMSTACVDVPTAYTAKLEWESCVFPPPLTTQLAVVPVGCPYRYINAAGDTITVTPFVTEQPLP